ncbi:hypothetical protein MD484_g5489, partial [Candolleomyces efflorescens]
MPPLTRPELTHENKKLRARGAKLAKLAQCNDDALDVMLTLLEEASAGLPILRLLARSTLTALETVQEMDEKHGLIAQVLFDVIQTSYVVTLALQSSQEGRERIVEKRLSTYIQSFDETLQDIHEKLERLLEPKAGVFSFILQAKRHRNAVAKLHAALEKERANIQPLISTLTFRHGTPCQLPVDRDDLRKYAEETANLQLQSWKPGQSDSPRPNAFVSGCMTAEKGREDAVRTGRLDVACLRGSDVSRDVIRHRTKIGTVGNYNSGEVHGTMNQGCNFICPGHLSQELIPRLVWQQPPHTQPEWPRECYMPMN